MQRRTYETLVLCALLTAAGAGALYRYQRGQPRFAPLLSIALTGAVQRVYLDRTGEQRINLNLASFEELDALPGVSAAAARRIIARRAEQSFRDMMELAPLLRINERRFAAFCEIAYCGPATNTVSP